MKVLKALLDGGKYSINVKTDRAIYKDSMLKIIFEGEARYFKVTRIEAAKDELDIIATETGYSNRLRNVKYLNLMDLVGLNVEAVDDETSRRITSESCLL